MTMLSYLLMLCLCLSLSACANADDTTETKDTLRAELTQMSDGEVMMTSIVINMQLSDKIVAQTSLEELRQVTIVYGSGKYTSYLVRSRELDEFIKATIALHGPDGRGKEAISIGVSRAAAAGPYWWSSSTLDKREALVSGATDFNFDHHWKVVWKNPNKKTSSS